MTTPIDTANSTIASVQWTNSRALVTGATMLMVLTAVMAAIAYVEGQVFSSGTLVPTLTYQGTTAGASNLVIAGSIATPSTGLNAAAIWQRVTANTQAGDNMTTFTSGVKTNAAPGTAMTAGWDEMLDIGGGSSTFSEGRDSRCYVRGAGGTCGGVVGVSGTDAGTTVFGNLIGVEAGLINNTGTNQPTFTSFNPNHEATGVIASNLAATKGDAAFVVNPNNQSPFRTGLLITGSGAPNASGVGVDDTGIASLGTLPVGINFAASVFTTAAIITPGFEVDPSGNVVGLRYHETLFTPASSSAACNAGDYADDAGYHYVCTATNTWKRVALSSF